jgi:Flp pilus assembly pilin Flp
MAKNLINRILALRLWTDLRGQDMMEYALFIAAIMVLYVAFSPSVAASVTSVLSKVSSTLTVAAST